MNIPNLTGPIQTSQHQQIMQQQQQQQQQQGVNHLLAQGNYNNQGFNRLNRQPSIGSNRSGNHSQPQQQINYSQQQQGMMLGGLPSATSSGGSSPSLNNGNPYSMMSFLHQNGGSNGLNGSVGHNNLVHNTMSRWLDHDMHKTNHSEPTVFSEPQKWRIWYWTLAIAEF